MSNQLMLPSGVDKLSLPQKVVAGGLVGVAAYFALPILFSMMVNLLMVVVIGVPMLFVAYNYQMFWLLFKNISWHVTKFLIGLDVLSYMDRYLDWVREQGRVIAQSETDLTKELEGLNGQIEERERSYNQNMERASIANKASNTNQRDIALSNATDDKDFIETLAPIRDEAEKKVEYLAELSEVYATKQKQLEYRVKAQKAKFQSLRAMSKGLRAAAGVIGGTGGANQLYQETENQLIGQMNQFSADIKMFDKVIKPAIETNRFDEQLRQEQGMKLLENFKSRNFQLTEGN